MQSPILQRRLWLFGSASFLPVTVRALPEVFSGGCSSPGMRQRSKVSVLSGGEQARYMLAGMMLTEANVLMLDEPTNHLDMESLTALNNGLIAFPEVLLFASRDHQLVSTVANRILEIT